MWEIRFLLLAAVCWRAGRGGAVKPLECPQKPDCGRTCLLETEYAALQAKYAALVLENQRLRQTLDYVRTVALSVSQTSQV